MSSLSTQLLKIGIAGLLLAYSTTLPEIPYDNPMFFLAGIIIGFWAGMPLPWRR